MSNDTDTPTPTITPDELSALNRLSRAMDGFPAVVVPANKVNVRTSADGGAGLLDILGGMALDLEKIGQGNQEMLARYEADRTELVNLRRDIAAFRRILGTGPTS